MDVNQLIEDKRFVKYVINKCITCYKMMSLMEERPTYDHNVYCPFHDNVDTPSARLYKNKDGSDTLFCFSEHRTYRSSDFITKGLVNYRLESIFYKVWVKLSKETQELLLSNYEGDVSYIPEKFANNLEQMQTFREGKINISELNQLILDSLK